MSEVVFHAICFFAVLFEVGVPLKIMCFIAQNACASFLYASSRWQLTLLNAAWLVSCLHFKVLSFFFGTTSFALCILLPIVCVVEAPPANTDAIEYPVGYFDYEYAVRDKGSYRKHEQKQTIGRIFYPAAIQQQPREHSAEAPYFWNTSASVVRAIATQFIPAWSAFLVDHFDCTTVSMKWCALPADTKRKYPVVIFSHDLGGTRETSTRLAISLAKQGIICCCVEHTDESAALARYINGDTVQYDLSIAPVHSQQGIQTFKSKRRSQTKMRIEDIQRTVLFLLALNSSDFCRNVRKQVSNCSIDGANELEVTSLLSEFRGRLDMCKVSLGGHGLGAASAFCGAVTLSELRYLKVYTVFTLDLAFDWIPEEFWHILGKKTSGDVKPLGNEECLNETSLLGIFSETWVKQDWNFSLFCKILSKHRKSYALGIRGSSHISLCDVLL